jgi:hypothetical protein
MVTLFQFELSVKDTIFVFVVDRVGVCGGFFKAER